MEEAPCARGGAAAVQLADQGQLDRGEALLEAVRGVERGDQLMLGRAQAAASTQAATASSACANSSTMTRD